MPPVRTRVTRLSEVERNRQFVSPARGRGRRRRPNSVATDSSRPIPTASAVVNAAGGTTQSETDDTHAIQDLQANPSGEFDVNHQCLIPPIDIFPPAVDFAGPNFSVAEYQPSVINSYFDPVSFHVPEKLKNQIWEGKFIDISLLLRSARELDGHLETQGQIEIRNGVMCLVKPKHNSFLSIEKWSSAFIIFTSIMLEKYRTRAQELLKYMRDIRLAASRSSGWFRYEEQFRLRKQADPQSSWGIINSELWLLYITNGTHPSQPSGKNSAAPNMHRESPGNYPQYKTQVNTLFCKLFNAGINCKFAPNCRFSHRCKGCGGDHPASKCRATK